MASQLKDLSMLPSKKASLFLVLVSVTACSAVSEPVLDKNAATAEITYQCSDGSLVHASYPTSDTAIVRHDGRSVKMEIAVSASGARYIGGGMQWWTKGTTQGMLAPLADGETIASARGIDCIAT